MVQVRSDGEEEEDPNDIVSSHSLTQMQHSPEPELPTLPFDVLPEILCRLPVKLLVQLRCLCKFFNSLISDPKFAKKHLQFSTKRPHLVVETYSINKDESVLHHSPIPSLFSTSSVLTQTQLYPLSTLTYGHNYLIPMCSCDGIFVCRLNAEDDSYCLWNPSIRKSKLLPPLENHKFGRNLIFGYDHFIDNYKVVAVSSKNEWLLLRKEWCRVEATGKKKTQTTSFLLTQMQQLTTANHSPEPMLPTLPFDVLPEILCRLPVKLLVQLRCLCKFFNSLISDPNFATKRHHLMLTSRNQHLGEYVLYDSPIPSLFSTSNVITQTQNITTWPQCALAMASLSACSTLVLIVCGTLPLESLSYCLLWRITN